MRRRRLSKVLGPRAERSEPGDVVWLSGYNRPVRELRHVGPKMHDREKPEPPYSDRHGLEEHVERALRSLRAAADVEMLARNVLTELASVVPVVQAALYVIDSEGATELSAGVSRGRASRSTVSRTLPRLRLAASYAATGDVEESFAVGEGLVGQCAREQRKLSVSDVPAEHFRIRSGLGVSAPRQLTLLPVSGADPVAAVLELATFEPLSPLDERRLARLTEGLAPLFHDLLPSVRRDQVPSSRSSLRGSAREASPYKPELFARMGHELRTPLNSLLVLSQMLAENADRNLTPKQMTFARAINASGNELLSLINEILELAKIESNALSIEPVEMTLEQLREHLELSFRPLATEKQVAFLVDMRSDLPAAIVTDPKRLHQVLKNLLSNALRFSEKGTVSLSVSRARFGWSSEHAVLNQAEAVIAFGVTHSRANSTNGERSAFADVFGGSREGADPPARVRLDCTVSREIARLLGGELRVGAADAGSTVTLYLPAAYRPPSSSIPEAPAPGATDTFATSSPVSASVLAAGGAAERGPVTVGSANATPGEDRVILIIEGDAELEDSVVESAGVRGYRVVTTSNIMGEMAAPTKALPSAVLLDLRAKDLEGWIVLDRLRQDPATRHIPVAALSAREHAHKARRMGAAVLLEHATPLHIDAALAALELYAPARERRVLLVQLGATPAERDVLTLIAAEGVDVRVMHSAEQGLAALGAERFHACVWILGAAEPPDFTSLGALPPGEQTPIIVYAGRPLKSDAEQQLRNCSDRLTLKIARSLELLLHEVSLCVHRPEAAYSSSQRHVLAKAARHPPELAGLRVLLIDPDVRNVFAMTSALERHGALVSYADNLQAGLSLIDREPSIAAVLADAGLALEDDHGLLRHARHARHPALPFIALASEPSATERERCIRAGASHYAAKPIAARHLISLLRVASADGAERGLVVCR